MKKHFSVFSLSAAMICCAALFCVHYHAQLGGTGSVNYFPGLGNAIRYAERQAGETVYISPTVNQPYIFALLYTETPPETFVQSAEIQNRAAQFHRVERFAGFEFSDPARADTLILYPGEAAEYRRLSDFGHFTVCVPR